MHVLAGGLRADAGTMAIDGAAVRAGWSARGARGRHRADPPGALALRPPHGGREHPARSRTPPRRGRYDRAAARAEAARVLAPFHHPELHPDRGVGDLPIAARQVVEICRAVSAQARVVLMDEPTSSLPREDVERLFGLIARLRADGVAVVYISHFLEEVRAIADDLSILRDGRTVWTRHGRRADRSADHQPHGRPRRRRTVPGPRAPPSDTVRLEAAGRVGSRARARGESARSRRRGPRHRRSRGRRADRIAAWSDGPRASGRPRAPVGRRPASCRCETRAPWTRLAAGLGYLSEDRKGEGLTLPMSLADNVTCTRYAVGESPRRHRWLRPAHAGRSTGSNGSRSRRGRRCRPCARCRAATSRRSRSDGCSIRQAAVWLLDEPTRGVDVGSKVHLYEAIAACGRPGLRGGDRQLLPAGAVRPLRLAGGHESRAPHRHGAALVLDSRVGHGGGHWNGTMKLQNCRIAGISEDAGSTCLSHS